MKQEIKMIKVICESFGVTNVINLPAIVKKCITGQSLYPNTLGRKPVFIVSDIIVFS